jgi:hypothetical protein
LNKEIVKKYSNDYKPLVALTLSLGLLLIYTTMAIQPTQNLYMQMQAGATNATQQAKSGASQAGQTAQSLMNKTGETLQSFANKTGETLQKINPLK